MSVALQINSPTKHREDLVLVFHFKMAAIRLSRFRRNYFGVDRRVGRRVSGIGFLTFT